VGGRCLSSHHCLPLSCFDTYLLVYRYCLVGMAATATTAATTTTERPTAQAAITLETSAILGVTAATRTGPMTGKGGVMFGGLRIALLQGAVLDGSEMCKRGGAASGATATSCCLMTSPNGTGPHVWLCALCMQVWLRPVRL
jgi:hypothetical protein